MLSFASELKNSEKVIGLKQVGRALRDGSASKVFIAYDADNKLTAPIVSLCKKTGVDFITGFTMEQLGHAADIDVGASVVAIVKQKQQ